MRFSELSHCIRHILPTILVLSVITVACQGEERFPNELNSEQDEPRVSLPDVASTPPAARTQTEAPPPSDPLLQLVLKTRETQRRRLLSTAEHTPWQIMHGLLALRHDFVITDSGKPISGMDWVSTGPTFRDEYWFEKSQYGGRAHPYSIPYAFEGHVNQFLAILSMSGLSLDHQFGTADGPITMRDMLRHAQMTVNDKEEITWTLWALSRYLPPDAQWKNAKGELWSIERLVDLQTEKSLQGAPCGGTHGLFAQAHARNVYLRKGMPLRGVWLKSENKIRKYIQTARMQQNSNGTLSSNFFRTKEYKKDFDKRMASSGHILEFLMIALPQEELSEPWVRRAIEATCRDLMENRHEFVSVSPLYHTVNALTIYAERVAPTAVPGNMAKANQKTRTISSSSVPGTLDAVPPVPVLTQSEDTPALGSTDGATSKGAAAATGDPVVADNQNVVPLPVPASDKSMAAGESQTVDASQTANVPQTAVSEPAGESVSETATITASASTDVSSDITAAAKPEPTVPGEIPDSVPIPVNPGSGIPAGVPVVDRNAETESPVELTTNADASADFRLVPTPDLNVPAEDPEAAEVTEPAEPDTIEAGPCQPPAPPMKPEEKPAEKHRWKATPLDRRRPIVIRRIQEPL